MNNHSYSENCKDCDRGPGRKPGRRPGTADWNRRPLHRACADRDTETVDIYAGMIHGVNLFIKESLNKGNVQEIRTEDAVIFAHRSTQYPVACMLVATKSSRVLRDALKTFAEKFYARYAPHFSNTSETGAFESATTFVAESFPFIPDYSAPP